MISPCCHPACIHTSPNVLFGPPRPALGTEIAFHGIFRHVFCISWLPVDHGFWHALDQALHRRTHGPFDAVCLMTASRSALLGGTGKLCGQSTLSATDDGDEGKKGGGRWYEVGRHGEGDRMGIASI